MSQYVANRDARCRSSVRPAHRGLLDHGQAARPMAHRHRVRKGRGPPCRWARGAVFRSAGHRDAAAPVGRALRVGAGRGRRPHRRAARAQGVDHARARRSGRAERRAVRERALRASRVRRAHRQIVTVGDELDIAFLGLGMQPIRRVERVRVGAQAPLRHHVAAHGAGRHARPAHDDADRDRAGQPRLRQRGRRDAEDARRRWA